MRTTVDIPDETYRTIKVLAAERGDTMRVLILEGLDTVMRTRKPAGRGRESTEALAAGAGPIEVDRETNDELIGFP
jgi:hypothetical protein